MKKIIALILIALTAGVLASCAFGPGTQDWTAPLVGDYEIYRCSVHNIALTKKESGQSDVGVEVVGAEIYAVAWNDEHIFLQREPMKEVDETGDYYKEPHGEISYYVVEVGSGEVFGPFDLTAFEAKCADIGEAVPAKWTDVRDLKRD